MAVDQGGQATASKFHTEAGGMGKKGRKEEDFENTVEKERWRKTGTRKQGERSNNGEKDKQE